VDIHRRIVDLIDAGRRFAVATVLESDGSTPRKAGVKAAIDETGRIWGTIGGGAVEAEAERQAVEACRSLRPAVFDLALQGARAEEADPICGGTMRVLIDPTAAKDRDCYASAARAVERRARGVIVTTIQIAQETTVSARWCPSDDPDAARLFPGYQAIHGCLERESPALVAGASPDAGAKMQALLEPVVPRPLLLIAGGGHIGQALARQAVLIGFDVTVLDDRPEFADPALFPESATTRCAPVAESIASFPVARDTYIVIVMRGHRHDAEALEACIHAPAAYIGMIGSTRKVALMRQSFLESGIATEEELDRVFAPIGLDIGAATVPEIATSIAAQLVAVRRGSDGRAKPKAKGAP
jgi:xanthine dehydrogenase accessory factor